MSPPHVIVIGAGSTGSATAHDLALRGLHVTVIDRGEVASGTTGRNHRERARKPLGFSQGRNSPLREPEKNFPLLDTFSQTCYTQAMKQTMLLKLAPTPEQATALLDTMHTFNAACDYIAEQAFEARVANKFELQKMTYGELRTTYHLPAQLAIRAISKTTDVYKRDKSIQPTFKPEGAIVYDERVMSFKGLTTVSLLTLSGRVLVPFLIGKYQESRLGSIKGQADLLERNGTFSLAVTLEVPTPTPATTDETLGIDLGIINLATDSSGETFSGLAVDKTRQRHHALRQRLQKRGTKNAKRR